MALVDVVGYKGTKERILIDGGDLIGKNNTLLANLKAYLDANKGIYISKILLTYSATGKYYGIFNILKLLQR